MDYAWFQPAKSAKFLYSNKNQAAECYGQPLLTMEKNPMCQKF